MADFFDLITPAELTGYAREALAARADNQFGLQRWLPARQVNDLTYRFSRGGGGLTEAASFRAYDAEPRFGRREGISRVTGEMPAIGEQYVLGEYDQLRLRNATDEIRNLLMRDAARIAASIDARFELARGDALVNASLTIEEDDLAMTVDFARDSSMEVTAAVPWTDHANADVVDELEGWLQAYSDLNGGPPGAVLTSRKVMRNLARNAQIQAQLFPNSPDRRLTPADLNAFLEEFGIPPITTYEAKVARNGVSTRVIPEDRFLFLPESGTTDTDEGQLGATLWGTTLEAQEADYGIEPADHPGVVVAAFKESKTPIRVFTIGAAIGVPIMANPNLAMVADVL
ncbi:major capsid protein [Amycolatopsis japonica]